VDRLRLVALSARGWRAYAAPAAFLLAVTVAVVLVQASRHTSPSPAPATVMTTKKPLAPKPRFYHVRAGDTLAAIATRTRISLTDLRARNPSVNPTLLFIGEKIRLR